MSVRVSMSEAEPACSGDMYWGVPRNWPGAVAAVWPVSGTLEGLGDAEVDDFRGRRAVLEGDEDVGGLEIAMDDAFLMGVLNGHADLGKDGEAVGDGESVGGAEGGDGRASDVLHDEVRMAGGHHAAVVDAGDIGVLHEGEGLAFGLETREDAAGVHAGLDEFDGDVPMQGGLLFGEEDGAVAAFANELENGVGADLGAGGDGIGEVEAGGIDGGIGEEFTGAIVGVEEALDGGADRVIVAAGAAEAIFALFGGEIDGCGEDLTDAQAGIHRRTPEGAGR